MVSTEESSKNAPEDAKSIPPPEKRTPLLVPLVESSIGFVASVLQIVTMSGPGVWIMVTILGVVISAFGAVRGYRYKSWADVQVAQVAAAVGGAAIAVGIIGSGWGLWGDTFDPPPTPGPTTSTSSSTAGTSAPDTEQPPINPGQAVSLAIVDVTAEVPRTITATVNQAAPAGRRYWVILRVDFGGGDVEYYGHAPLTVGPGQRQTVHLQIPGYAPFDVDRELLVWAAPSEVDRLAQERLGQDVDQRDFFQQSDCSDCDAASPVKLTPR